MTGKRSMLFVMWMLITACGGNSSPPVDGGFDGTDIAQPPYDPSPEGWNCPWEFYGTGDGCDCGCGILDSDCVEGACNEPGCVAEVCDYCWDDDWNNACGSPGGTYPYLECTSDQDCQDGICENGFCMDDCIDNAISGPFCNEGFICWQMMNCIKSCSSDEDCYGNDGLDCCMGPMCTPAPYCPGATGPDGWLCPGAYYQDGSACDCGCGIPDPDCPENSCTQPGCEEQDCTYCWDENQLSRAC